MVTSFFRRGAIGLAFAALSFGAYAQEGGTLQKVIDSGELNVGVISGFPPWEFTNAAGELDGYEIAVAKALGRDLGVKVNLIQSNGPGRIPNLQTGKVDVVIGALNYTPERAKIVAFTRAYAHPSAQFVVKADSPYQTMMDLNASDVTLGYTTGGLEGDMWKELLPKANLTTFNTVTDVHQAFVSGRLTATFIETSDLNSEFMAQHPGQFRLLEPPYMKYSTRMAVRPDDMQWWRYLDNWVDQLIYTGENQKLWEQFMAKGTTALRSD